MLKPAAVGRGRASRLLSAVFLCLSLAAPAAFAQDQAGRRLAAFLTADAKPQYSPSLYQAMAWREIGPYRGGRVTAVAGVAGDPLTYYMGATGGGLWKTTNAGVTWANVSDNYFRTTTIGAIGVAPGDPNTVYVGTGEAPVRGVTTSHGDGVYKTTDGGKTWRHVGLDNSRQISRVVVDPHDPEVVYVAVQGSPWAPTDERGVYRSRDGGATWTRLLFVNDTTGASYLSLDPQNPRVLYAAMWDHRRRPWTVRSGGPGSGLYKTTDGGDSWTRLAAGLPALMGNTSVTVSPANPDRLWAMIEATEGGVFRSDDGGANWKRVNGDPGIRDRGWYYTHIFADPVDAETVYVLAAPMMKSTDGGVSFQQIRTRHGDNHDLWINPANNKWMIEGNDGGAHVSLDGGGTWSRQDNQPTAQIYRVIADNLFPYNLYAGQQDNSSIRIAGRTLTGGIGREDWTAVAGSESAQIGLDPDNPDLIYGTSLLGTIDLLNTRTGERRDIEGYPYFSGFRPARELRHRFNWNAPVVVSSHDPRVIYHAAQVVFKSVDRGQSWTEISPDLTRNEVERQGTTGGPISIEGAGGEHYNTILYLAESPHDAKVLWAGADDGMVHVTRDGGATWANVTPRDYGDAQVNAIEVSPHDPASAYIAVTRYKFNDFTPLIYKTSNYGKSWRKIVTGIAEGAFVRVVREDAKRQGLLYAGTEAGAYVSFNDGKHWQPLQLNLPPVPITDLTIRDDDLVAATQGRGFWILDDLTPLQQIDQRAAGADVHLFAPRPALRLDQSGFEAKPGKNPPDGAVIYYKLKHARDATDSPITLEILDAGGGVVRTFTSKPAAQAKRTVVKGVRRDPPAPALGVNAGMNRYVWNLRRAPTVEADEVIRYVSQRPYRLAPGAYGVRLTVDGVAQTQPLTVIPDPRRASIPATSWHDQQQLLAKIYDMVNEVHGAVNKMRSLSAQVARLIELTKGNDHAAEIATAGRAVIDRIAAWEVHVPQSELPGGVQDRVSYPSRILSTQVFYLMMAVDQDPPVTAGAKTRFAELERQWAGIEAGMGDILDHDLAAFNALFEDYGIPQAIIAE